MHTRIKKNKQDVNLQMNMSTGPVGKNLLPFAAISPRAGGEGQRAACTGRLHCISQEDESLLHLDKSPRLHSPATKQDNLSAFGRPALSKNSGWDVMRRGPAGKWGIKRMSRLCRSRSESGCAPLRPVRRWSPSHTCRYEGCWGLSSRSAHLTG